MWKININKIDGGIVDVTAIYEDGSFTFAWSSTIKTDEIEDFVIKAKEELVKKQEEDSEKESFRSKLETLINQ